MPWRTARSCSPQKLSKPGRSARPLDEDAADRVRPVEDDEAEPRRAAAASMQSIIVAWYV